MVANQQYNSTYIEFSWNLRKGSAAKERSPTMAGVKSLKIRTPRKTPKEKERQNKSERGSLALRMTLGVIRSSQRSIVRKLVQMF